MQRFKKKHFIEKISKGKRIVSKSLEGDVKERAANIRKQKVLAGRIIVPDIAGMQVEVTEFYSSLSFTDETVFFEVGGIKLEFDSISLGKILNVHTTGEFTVKDK
ncbi:hypothetical protein HAX54_029410 [Datura stramonium]|uniref:Uncharacterized protein n=1 Tax=Datura stramonium TaxID=4076 RepID=A0ABS8V5W0_DATST|nr:hypothetical protein [Datura stramonium]